MQHSYVNEYTYDIANLWTALDGTSWAYNSTGRSRAWWTSALTMARAGHFADCYGHLDDDLYDDAAGRLLRGTVGYRNGTFRGNSLDAYYGPMGAFAAAVSATRTVHGGAVTERFMTDAVANRSKRETSG